MNIRRHNKAITCDENGIAAVEFGLISTVFFTMMMVGFDFGHSMYMRTVVEGALQQAARSSTLQTASDTQQLQLLDDAVSTQVAKLNSTATVNFSRRFYRSFTEAKNARHEVDINSANPAKNDDGKCETGETYIDVNNNNTYDLDGGNAGQGGAQDIVVYTTTVSYPRLFPLYGLMGLSKDVSIKASTVLQNQPYSAQSQYGPATTRNCP